jgi:hypothetical protein
LRTEVVNRLQELIAANEDGQDILLFDRLCRIARDGAGTARKWTRHTLLAQLRGTVRLKIAPNYKRDLDLLQKFSAAGLADVSEEIVGFRVERPSPAFIGSLGCIRLRDVLAPARQAHGEDDRPARGDRFDSDVAVVCRRDLLGDEKPETEPAGSR